MQQELPGASGGRVGFPPAQGLALQWRIPDLEMQGAPCSHPRQSADGAAEWTWYVRHHFVVS